MLCLSTSFVDHIDVERMIHGDSIFSYTSIVTTTMAFSSPPKTGMKTPLLATAGCYCSFCLEKSYRSMTAHSYVPDNRYSIIPFILFQSSFFSTHICSFFVLALEVFF